MRSRRRNLCLCLATAVPRDRETLVQSVRTNVEAMNEAIATGEVGRLNGDGFFDLPDHRWDTQSD